jgi:hypothetical protein
MQSRKVIELLSNNKLQPRNIIHIVKNYAKHPQLRNDWERYEPSYNNKSSKKISAGKQVEKKVYKLEESPCSLKKKHEDEVRSRKSKKLTRNLGEIKTNIDVVKELLEPEGKEVRINRKSSQLIGGRPQGKMKGIKALNLD